MQVGKHSRKLIELRKAIRQGELTSEGLLPIEGPILVEEAQKSRIEIVDLFVREGVRPPNVDCRTLHEVPRDAFVSIQATEHSQGVIATVRPSEFTLDETVEGAPALIVVLARLQDPGNVGTILRISEAFGATGCIALRGTASFYNSKVVRATAGSLFRLPHVQAVDLTDLVSALKQRSVRIVGTAPSSESSIEKWNWSVPVAVMIGNEGAGLSPDELKVCDTVLRIPHSSSVESLNSAISAAVILYEASNQRRI
jgi:TrmH family RNA methyltransferase